VHAHEAKIKTAVVKERLFSFWFMCVQGVTFATRPCRQGSALIKQSSAREHRRKRYFDSGSSFLDRIDARPA
jgi:hypothetical protein